MKKKSKLIFLIVFIIFLVSGCSFERTNTENDNDRIKIITTLFPQYDFARSIAKDNAEVILLLPPGMEAHAYEPSPQDIANIKKADIFIYTGEAMEPWAHKIIHNLNNESLIVVDASKNIDLMDEDEHDDHNHDLEDAHDDHDHDLEDVYDDHNHDLDGNAHSHDGKDPHIWLDPIYAIEIVNNILEGLVEADPSNASFYQENARAYKDELKELDVKFIEAFEKTKSKTIIYAGHFAFGYFAKRYDLSHISPYVGFTPDAEPTPQRIVKIINAINETGLKAIYYEELIDPKVAKVISDGTGADMYLLHGAHNVTKDELNSGISYIQIMEENLEKLKKGLGYYE